MLEGAHFFVFFWRLECVGHSFADVTHFVFLRDVWTRTQRAAVASRRATNLATHLPNLEGEHIKPGRKKCSESKIHSDSTFFSPRIGFFLPGYGSYYLMLSDLKITVVCDIVWTNSLSTEISISDHSATGFGYLSVLKLESMYVHIQ